MIWYMFIVSDVQTATNTPLEVMAGPVLEVVEVLLKLREDEPVSTACRMLKVWCQNCKQACLQSVCTHHLALRLSVLFACRCLSMYSVQRWTQCSRIKVFLFLIVWIRRWKP